MATDPSTGQPTGQSTDPSQRKSAFDWTSDYQQNPSGFLDWYKTKLSGTDAAEAQTGMWADPNSPQSTPWGNKNERETADSMASMLAPNLNLNDLQNKYSSIYARDQFPSEWSVPNLAKAQAADFRSPGYQQDQFSAYKNKIMPDLAQNFKQSQMSLARRGVARGGIAEGNSAQQAANASYQMAQGKQDIANASEKSAQDVEQTYLNKAVQQRNMQQQAYNDSYNSALTSYMQRQQSTKAVGGLLGTGVALAAGGGFAAAPVGYAAGSAIF